MMLRGNRATGTAMTQAGLPGVCGPIGQGAARRGCPACAPPGRGIRPLTRGRARDRSANRRRIVPRALLNTERSRLHVPVDTNDVSPKKPIAAEIAELQAMDVQGLAERYEALFGRRPRVRHKDWLWKRIAWKLQEQRLGGLSKVAKARLEDLIGQIELPPIERVVRPKAPVAANGEPMSLRPGMVLMRRWHDQEVRVRVLEAGFEWEGQVLSSLSAVARAATGAHWNGRLFFGLTKRGKGQ